MSGRTFWGYRRADGRVGIRNHVVVLPLDDISNAAVEAVAGHIQGTLAIPHPYGRLQFGADLELFFRTLIGTGSNPNVAAVVVVGIEPGWTRRVVEGIAATGKPVEGLSIERHGDIDTVARASRVAKTFVHDASELRREACELSELYIGVKCGESDTTSGLASNPTVGDLVDKLVPGGTTVCFGETSEITGTEQVCASRAATPEVAQRFLETWSRYNDMILAHKTDDLSDSQPTKGNIEGGLSTIEEKAFGNLQKIGRVSRFVDVLEPAAAPPQGPGRYLMGPRSAAAECVTLQAASGAAVHLFPTGQGNVVGHPIMPVIKLTANPRTAREMAEHIDLDVSGLLQRQLTLDQAGDALIDMTVRTANGRRTAAEVLGHREFVLTKLSPRA